MSQSRSLRYPTLVLDWNLIQSMPASQDIPDRFQCVVPAHVLHEIATKEDGRDKAAMRKFFQWGSRNVHRFWIGRLTKDLFQRQVRATGKRLTMRDVVEPRQTRLWRRALQSSQVDLQQVLAKIKDSPPVKLRNHQIDELVRFSDAITVVWGKRPQKRIPRPSEKGEWVRLPQLATDLVETRFFKWWRKEWRRYVNEDPHRFAVIRWARFLAWYFVKRAEGQTHRFANNFDDIHYGLLASYTGHLGTDDRGLEEATLAIFPSLRIVRLSDLPLVHSPPFSRPK
jgi:hypothetical protein